MAEENLGWWNALVIAFGIPLKIQAILIRIAWVVIVSVHILWACGLLTWLGLSAPFARADSVDQILRTQQITAQITIGTELGKAIAARCHDANEDKRGEWTQYIERLQTEYQAITKQRYPERCR